MFNWLHHLFNPHCPECSFDKHYIQEKLSLLLEQERAEKFRLLQLLAPSLENNIVARSEPVDISTLRRSPKTMMREMERNSEKEAEHIRKRNAEEKIESIEKEAKIG